MNNERTRTWRSRAVLLLFVVIAAVAVIAASILLRDTSGQPVDTAQEQQAEEAPEKLTDTIAIPQFGWLNLTADSREQMLTFQNPEQNFCWFRISLLLEDGTVLWTSELIAPGEESAPVVLSMPLAAGEYENAVLKYECFRMDEEQTPLNGAEGRLTLKVA